MAEVSNGETGCSIALDGVFGPGVRCNQFDFTLFFEQSIFGIGITALSILFFVIQLSRIFKKPIQTVKHWIHPTKICISVVLVALNIALVALWTKEPITKAPIAAAVLGFVASILVTVLEVIEHPRSLTPSTVVSLYLLCSVTGQFVQIRTLFIRDYVPQIASVLAADTAVKVILLVLESLPKKSFLKPKEGGYAPEGTAGVFSRAFLFWLNPLFLTGRRKILDADDLCTLEDKLLGDFLQTHMRNAWDKCKHTGKWAYLRAMWTVLRKQFYSTVFPRACLIGFEFAQTFLIHDSISYLERPGNMRNKNHAYGLIGAAFLIYGGIGISTAIYQYRNFKLMSIFRGAAVGIIYEKSLTSKSGYNEMAAVTLMSTDVDRVAMSIARFSDMWARVAELVIGIWLLWRQVGIIALAPIAVVIVCFGLQTQVAKKLPRTQKPWVAAIQRRVGLTGTVLGSMKAVKLAGLPMSMITLLQYERVRELNLGKAMRRWMVAQNAVSFMSVLLAPAFVFMAYAIQAKNDDKAPLTAARAFTSLALLALITQPASMLLNAFAAVAQGLSCVRRIQTFIENEWHDERKMLSPSSSKSSEEEESSRTMVTTTDLELQYSKTIESEKPNEKINFTAQRGSITAVFGAVGAGKTTFLSTLLGEISPKSGAVSVGTPYVGFCAQTAWVQNCSVRKNIIGPSDFNEDWYWQVVRVCDLEIDFATMPQGDLTLVGSGGIILSGGQKHRIGLARVLYSRCGIYLLDDFFSSLDRKTRTNVMHRLFAPDGYARKTGCTVVLATHTRSCAQFVDQLLVLGEDGSQQYYGPPKAWDGSIGDSHDDEDDEKPPGEKEIAKSDSNRSSADADADSDSKLNLHKTITKQSLEMTAAQKKAAAMRQTGDTTIWAYYAKTMGMWQIVICLVSILAWVFTTEFPRIWIKLNTGPEGTINTSKFIGVYFLLFAASFILQGSMIAHVLIHLAPKSAAKLHKILLNATFRAPMSFFANTDHGEIINRFSQDMTLVDMQLPVAAWQVFFSIFLVTVDGIFVCLGSSYMAATLPIIIFVVYLVQKFYLLTSRQMRLLDLELKSPLYTHFTETLDGLASIRAFGWQSSFNKLAISKLNVSQKPYHLLWCIQRWLMLVLNLSGGMMGTVVIALALLIPKSSDGGLLGVALTSITNFNMALGQLVMAWTEAETCIGAVTRTREYEMETPREEREEDIEPDESWPIGDIAVQDVGVTFEDGTVALKNVSFSIKAGQKIGICGRSGSGKSTIISALLRLVDTSSGSLLVDGQDISQFRRNAIRERIICLPQDAILFPRDFTFNLDPESRLSDSQKHWLAESLQRVGLWELVEQRGGLDGLVEPSALSHGEKQLLALARAIIRRRLDGGRCILLLDEATSSLDEATQEKFQEIIETEFGTNTVVAIAHRLETVRKVDVVIVLDKGVILKMGTPSEVL